ncbi:hypothetical protein V6N12_040600 [Hibiscus sabdariffa]|uniref:Uncharacterized protein n=1 Tax=Hibiscus sabdariffa TaxID=183260 RepID=A0ABR2E439_9ROSI
MTYWRFSMDDRAFTDSKVLVAFMSVNGRSLYWFGDDGSMVVFKDALSSVSVLRSLRMGMLLKPHCLPLFIVALYDDGSRLRLDDAPAPAGLTIVDVDEFGAKANGSDKVPCYGIISL